MPKVKTVTLTNICDRCGSQHDPSKFTDGPSWAQIDLQWSGEVGSRTYFGDRAGASFKGEAWLCMPCAEAFLKFIEPIAKDGK